MPQQARSKFVVTEWDEKPFDQMDGGPRLSRAKVSKVFQGDLEGDGSLEYLMTHRTDGTATFVGVERVIGRVGGRTGSFVLEHQGTFESGIAKGVCRVVPGSGTGELSGLKGEGSFAAEGREAPFALDYELEA